MQRRAFELTSGWDDVEEHEADPPALERLAEVAVPTLVLQGALDLDAIRLAAERVVAGLPDARLALWDDVAHLPSLERPEGFARLLENWLLEN
jgi:pimeloyl-ACP methyl ester carboxylesterase